MIRIRFKENFDTDLVLEKALIWTEFEKISFLFFIKSFCSICLGFSSYGPKKQARNGIRRDNWVRIIWLLLKCLTKNVYKCSPTLDIVWFQETSTWKINVFWVFCIMLYQVDIVPNCWAPVVFLSVNHTGSKESWK